MPHPLLQQAWLDYRSGQLSRAERLCHQARECSPDDISAIFLLGLVLLGQGRAREAVLRFQETIHVIPQRPEAHNNLGNAHAQLGEWEHAAHHFQLALKLNPDFAEAHNNLGNVVRDQGNFLESIPHYERAISLQPSYFEAINNLGIAFSRLRDVVRARECFHKALSLNPSYAEAHNNLGISFATTGDTSSAIERFRSSLRCKSNYPDGWNNLGIALSQENQFDEAERCFRIALDLRPDFSQAHFNLGCTLLNSGQVEDAIGSFREAVRGNPAYYEAHLKLGESLQKKGEIRPAIHHLLQAARICPQQPEVHCQLGTALTLERRFSAALQHLGKAIELRPDFAEAHFRKAETLLLIGEYQGGLEEYEWRGKYEQWTTPNLHQPLWDGTSLEGRRILLYAEKESGSTFQFLRYARLLKCQGATVFLLCSGDLHPIISQSSYIDGIYCDGEKLPDYDVRLPLASLAHRFGTRLENIPCGEPYLFASSALEDKWRHELSYISSFKVGIIWRGNSRHSDHWRRSIPLLHFAPLAIDNVHLISLQTGMETDQLQGVPFSITDLGSRFDSHSSSYMEIAAVLKNIDLLITADTAVAHLAGGMGVPVWVLLSHAPDCWWLVGREDTPWYPTMRLFRQSIANSWDDVFLRVADALRSAISSLEPHRSLIPTQATSETLNALGEKAARDGRFEEAVTIFRQALSLNAECPETQNNLGNVLRTLGKPQEAISYLEEAIRLRPDHHEAMNNLGIALVAVNKRPEAISVFRQATEIAPDYANAHNNMGIALLETQKVEQAIECFRQAIALQPNLANAHNNLGNALASSGQLEDGLECFRRALERQPRYPEAYNNLGNVLRELNRFDEAVEALQKGIEQRPNYADAYNNLGIVYSRQSKLAQAVESYRKAIELHQDHAAAHNNIGIAYAQQNEFKKAVASYERALRIKKDYAEAHNNLAIVLTQNGEFSNAFTHYEQAITLKKDYPEAHSNYGIALTESGKLESALEHYGRALELKDDYPDAHMNRALTFLLMGNYERGWEEYEWRWKCKDFHPRPFTQPLWDGKESLRHKRILLHSEQGLGDTFQFIRYAQFLKDAGATVLLRCPKPLLRIMSLCPFLDELYIEGGDLPNFDVHLPLLSLPHRFHTRLSNIPSYQHYLFASTELISRWRRELSYISSFKVGINWQGNPNYRGDLRRSIPLLHFAPLAAISGVRLISLQKGLGTEQLNKVPFTVTELGSQVDEQAGAFMDTAAVLKNLDLFITSDTALAHLAGGLGTPVWMALPYSPDWRWLLKREESPWYPSMRLFRQTKVNQWENVFERMASALRQKVERDGGQRSLLVKMSPEEFIDRIVRKELDDEENHSPVNHEELVRLRSEWHRRGYSRMISDDCLAELRSVRRKERALENDLRNLTSEEGPQFGLLTQELYRQGQRRRHVLSRLRLILTHQIASEMDYSSISSDELNADYSLRRPESRDAANLEREKTNEGLRREQRLGVD